MNASLGIADWVLTTLKGFDKVLSLSLTSNVPGAPVEFAHALSCGLPVCAYCAGASLGEKVCIGRAVVILGN